ncbi:MAG TPA: YtpI family protein [Aliicoccus persicus]|uniref:YtpI family protein n=1 Tax=Aliicoccus persicus TaxID=930138 RepID=A0A921DXD2_9STAP|nr:YtpI family protein [Aliicoccus persicus]
MDIETIYTLVVSILITLAFIAFALFIFYKVKQVRTEQFRGGRRQYYNSLSRIWFGAFLIIFGTSTIVQFQTGVAYIIGAVFIFFGLLNILSFNRRRKHFKSVIPDEDREINEWYESQNKDASFKHSSTKVLSKKRV